MPVLSVLGIIAVAAGLKLGETTIAQIDPLYFEGAAPKVRDVSSDAPPPSAPAYASASGWAGGVAAPARDCIDCPATLVETGGPRIPNEPLYAYSDPTIEPRWTRAGAPAEDADIAPEPAPIAASERVRRYADYPVSAEQAEQRTAPPRRSAAQTLEPDGL